MIDITISPTAPVEIPSAELSSKLSTSGILPSPDSDLSTKRFHEINNFINMPTSERSTKKL